LGALRLAIGERIRYYRNQKGWTQEQLAEALEIQGTYIGRVERGEQNLQLSTLEKIAEALHINANNLLIDSNEQLEQEEFIRRTIALLRNQSQKDQEWAYRVVREMFQR
jgi:transcriptional regulator with XRE-family HTH domain